MLAQTGVILSVSLIALWAISRKTLAPFTNEVEGVDFSGRFTKILETSGAAALLERRKKHEARKLL